MTSGKLSPPVLPLLSHPGPVFKKIVVPDVIVLVPNGEVLVPRCGITVPRMWKYRSQDVKVLVPRMCKTTTGNAPDRPTKQIWKNKAIREWFNKKKC